MLEPMPDFAPETLGPCSQACANNRQGTRVNMLESDADIARNSYVEKADLQDHFL